MLRSLNETDRKVLLLADRYVREQLVARELGQMTAWREYHKAGLRQLAAYPRRKPKKKDKK